MASSTIDVQLEPSPGATLTTRLCLARTVRDAVRAVAVGLDGYLSCNDIKTGCAVEFVDATAATQAATTFRGLTFGGRNPNVVVPASGCSSSGGTNDDSRKRLFIEQLPQLCADEIKPQLRHKLERFGTLLDLGVPTGGRGGRAVVRGIAFVEFEHPASAAEAMAALHDSRWEDRTLRVTYDARPVAVACIPSQPAVAADAWRAPAYHAPAGHASGEAACSDGMHTAGRANAHAGATAHATAAPAKRIYTKEALLALSTQPDGDPPPAGTSAGGRLFKSAVVAAVVEEIKRDAVAEIKRDAVAEIRRDAV